MQNNKRICKKHIDFLIPCSPTLGCVFNWQMGRELVQKKAEERWGAGVIEQVILDLKREFPNEDALMRTDSQLVILDI